VNITLTDDQKAALASILDASRICLGERAHLLTGYAGSGKTTLMQEVARSFLDMKKKVVLTAPTHKAVGVLRKKVAQAGIEAGCCTIHSLLSLVPYPAGAKTKLKRRKNAKHVTEDIVIIDECSMVDSELMIHIRKYLGHCFVLFVGDPAQLPPVGEKESETFATKGRSHLSTIMRQAQDNPVLQAAHAVREQQGKRFNLSWCKSATAKPYGVYMPNGKTDEWLKKAFTSDEFKADNDTFRYMCWTNAKVAEINTKVRRWIYGETIEPFSVGENVMMRAPIFSPFDSRNPLADRQILFNTNDEAPVVSIDASIIEGEFPERGEIEGWNARIPAWVVTLRHEDGSLVMCRIPKNQEDFDEINAQLVAEAKHESARWGDRHDFAMEVAKLQSVYCLTVHNSQGSTYKNAFVDVGDIKRRSGTNPLECQQMFYVAATRPTHALMLVNA
jgi:hypothetical protein